jgi:hypothetical protein
VKFTMAVFHRGFFFLFSFNLVPEPQQTLIDFLVHAKKLLITLNMNQLSVFLVRRFIDYKYLIGQFYAQALSLRDAS